MEWNSAATTTTPTTDAAADADTNNTPTELLDNDVIMGPYTAVTRLHAGNARFDQLVCSGSATLIQHGEHNVATTTTPCHSSTQQVAEHLYNQVEAYGGRFLHAVFVGTLSEEATLEWRLLDRPEAIQSILQALVESQHNRDNIQHDAGASIAIREHDANAPINLLPSIRPEPPISTIAPGGWTFSVDVSGRAHLTPITSPNNGASCTTSPPADYMQPYLDLVRQQQERQRLYQYEQELQQLRRRQQGVVSFAPRHGARNLLNEQATNITWNQPHLQQQQQHPPTSTLPIIDTRTAAILSQSSTSIPDAFGRPLHRLESLSNSRASSHASENLIMNGVAGAQPSSLRVPSLSNPGGASASTASMTWSGASSRDMSNASTEHIPPSHHDDNDIATWGGELHSRLLPLSSSLPSGASAATRFTVASSAASSASTSSTSDQGNSSNNDIYRQGNTSP